MSGLGKESLTRFISSGEGGDGDGSNQVSTDATLLDIIKVLITISIL